MSKVSYSALFSASMNAAAFDHLIDRDASTGRVNAAFVQALASAYGWELPTKPAACIATINTMLTSTKAPKLASGLGSAAKTRDVAIAVHALALALHAAGTIKNLPAVASLPDWTNAPEKKTPKIKVEKIVKEPAPENAESENAESDNGATDISDIAERMNSAVNLIVASAKAGALTAAQIAALRAVLDGAHSAPAATLKDAQKPVETA